MEFNIGCFKEKIICEENHSDTVVETVINGDMLDLYVSADSDRLKFIELEWNFDSNTPLFVSCPYNITENREKTFLKHIRLSRKAIA